MTPSDCFAALGAIGVGIPLMANSANIAFQNPLTQI